MVNDIAEKPDYPDYFACHRALEQAVKAGKYPPDARMLMRKKPDPDTSNGNVVYMPWTGSGLPPPGSKVIYTYERRLNHNQVMTFGATVACLIGMVIGHLFATYVGF